MGNIFRLIVNHQRGKLSGTANIFLKYEWGRDIKNEQEFSFRGQLLYRFKPSFEPAIEANFAKGTSAIGPLVSGFVRQSPRKKWRWALGIFAGLDRDAIDFIVKANIEYEF